MGFARALWGAEWAVDTKFSAAEELLKDPKLKATIAAVLKNGVEIVGAIEMKVKQKPSVGLPDRLGSQMSTYRDESNMSSHQMASGL